LEFFDDIRRPATAIEIIETLKYPQSSASALLHTLVDLGYLNYSSESHQYSPSDRVALLGHWVNPDIFSGGTLLSMMSRLAEVTGDTVMLVTRRGLFAQYIHVIQATKRLQLQITLGAMVPLVASTSGYALLSTYSDAQVRGIVNCYNVDYSSESPVVYQDVHQIISEIREKGYCFKTGVTVAGGATLSVPLPVAEGALPMAIGIAGVAEVMRENEGKLIALMRDELSIYLNSQ
jgi:DNA-binding IclR family transcriptional regulator